MKKDCFGVLYDPDNSDCAKCMVAEECKKVWTKYGSKKLEDYPVVDIEQATSCFGIFWDPDDKNCQICILRNFCGKVYELNKAREKEKREAMRIEVKTKRKKKTRTNG